MKSIEDKYRETFFSMNGRYPDTTELQQYTNKLRKSSGSDSTIIDLNETIV